MIGYNYTYKSFTDILDITGHLSTMGMTNILLCSIVVSCILLGIGVIFPSLILTHRQKIEKKNKRDKKKILTQILLQKEIEDEVEKEIQIKEENK